MKKHNQILVLLLAVVLFLSGCSGSQGNLSPAANGNGQQSDASTDEKYPWDSDANYKWKQVATAETMQDAMDEIVYFLDHADVKYEYILRDYFYSIKTGEKLPALWLYAMNEDGEWLDVVMMEMNENDFSENVLISPDSWGPDKSSLTYYRINENMSFYYSTGGKTPGPFNDNIVYYMVEIENGKFSAAIGGHPFAFNDVDSRHNYYNDEKGIVIQGRRKGTLEKVERPEPVYKTYTPAESLEEELEAVKKRLEETGLGYRWEMMDDTITVKGKEYPVVWLYAVNDLEEWVDVILTEDTELCYLLNVNRDILWDLRKDQRDKYNALHPGRAESESGGCPFGQTGDWVLEDVFYYGYSFILAGHGLAMRDCGSTLMTEEWNDEAKALIPYYDRTVYGFGIE